MSKKALVLMLTALFTTGALFSGASFADDKKDEMTKEDKTKK
jgi:hypothetical protein